MRRMRYHPVVFLGGSDALSAVMPEVVMEAAGGFEPGYNAAFHRGAPRVTLLWWRDVVAPSLRPRVVVHGLSAQLLNDAGGLNTGIIEDYVSAPIFHRKRVRGALQWIADRSELLRGYKLLLQPERLARGLVRNIRFKRQGEPVRRGDALRVTPTGVATDHLDHEFARMPKMTRLIEDLILANYSWGNEEFDAIAELVDDVRARGAVYVAAWMPATREFLERLPEGAHGGKAVKDAVFKVVRQHGGLAVEVDEDFTDPRWFADLIHLNGRGARTFSTALGTALADILKVSLPEA